MWFSRGLGLVCASWVAVFGAVSISACGGKVIVESEREEPESRGARFAAAVCGQIFECCGSAELSEVFNAKGLLEDPAIDYAGCRIGYRATWEAIVEPMIEQGEAAGTLDFDEVAFESCIGAYAQAPCSDVAGTSPYCAEMFVPKVAVGGACFTGLECVTGTCQIADSASQGTCAPALEKSGPGGECGAAATCDAQLYCNAGQCAALLPDGAPCTDNGQCQSTRCLGLASGAGSCGTLCQGGGPGAGPIDTTLETAAAQYAKAQCSRIFECCEPSERQELGAGEMASEIDCLRTYGTSAAIGFISLHNASVAGDIAVEPDALFGCLEKLGSQSCLEFGKRTDFACPDGVVGLLEAGDACANDVQCASLYCAEAPSGQSACAELPGALSPCDGRCADGFYCDEGSCAPQKPAFAPCDTDNECAEGGCYGPSGAKTCSLICTG